MLPQHVNGPLLKSVLYNFSKNTHIYYFVYAVYLNIHIYEDKIFIGILKINLWKRQIELGKSIFLQA